MRKLLIITLLLVLLSSFVSAQLNDGNLVSAWSLSNTSDYTGRTSLTNVGSIPFVVGVKDNAGNFTPNDDFTVSSVIGTAIQVI